MLLLLEMTKPTQQQMPIFCAQDQEDSQKNIFIYFRTATADQWLYNICLFKFQI